LVLWLIFYLGASPTQPSADRSHSTANSTPTRTAIPSKVMECRLRGEEIAGSNGDFHVERVELRGRYPINQSTRLAFRASVIDVSSADDSGTPLELVTLSTLEEYQEPDTPCFEDRREVGQVDASEGWVDWKPVLAVIPETLVPPRKGSRRLRVDVYAYDVDKPIEVKHGFLQSGSPLAVWSEYFDWTFEDDGWLENGEKRRECEELLIQIAVSMGFADGTLHESEADVIKTWITRRLDLLTPEQRDSRRKRLNAVLREAHHACVSRQFKANDIVDRFKAVATESARLEVLELCLDILAADGQAEDTELKAVNALATRLRVDLEHYESMRDKRLIEVASSLRSSVDYLTLLNIDRRWSPDQIRIHLNRLYSRWNSRAESLQDEESRKQAEEMLDVIARARKALIT